MGKTIERNYHIKEYLIKQSDDKLNEIIHSVSKLNLKEFTTLSLLTEIIRVNPKLMLELGALAASIRLFFQLPVEEAETIIFSFFFRENREDIIRLDSDIAAGNDQFAAGSADCDEHEIFHFKLSDLMPNYGSTLLGDYIKDSPPRDRGKLLELGVLRPVVKA